MLHYLLGIMMFLTALFLILLVLIQRGRGGGLAGAFGGAGGQSAFGTKAGDMFTKITIGTAAVWIVIAAMSVRLLNAPKASVLGDGGSGPPVIAPAKLPGEEDTGAGGGGADAGLLGDALEDEGMLDENGSGAVAPAGEAESTGVPAASSPAAATPAASEPAAPATPPPSADPPPGE